MHGRVRSTPKSSYGSAVYRPPERPASPPERSAFAAEVPHQLLCVHLKSSSLSARELRPKPEEAQSEFKLLAEAIGAGTFAIAMTQRLKVGTSWVNRRAGGVTGSRAGLRSPCRKT